MTTLNSSSLLQVKVADRTAVVTANAETTVVSPSGIQEAIDAETGKINFVTQMDYLYKSIWGSFLLVANRLLSCTFLLICEIILILVDLILN